MSVPEIVGHQVELLSTEPKLTRGPSTLHIMAEYDLTQTIIPYCDRHLVFPLLAHLAENELFEPEQVQNAQYELAKGTNMVDYAASLFEQLHPGDEPPAGATHML